MPFLKQIKYNISSENFVLSLACMWENQNKNSMQYITNTPGIMNGKKYLSLTMLLPHKLFFLFSDFHYSQISLSINISKL